MTLIDEIIERQYHGISFYINDPSVSANGESGYIIYIKSGKYKISWDDGDEIKYLSPSDIKHAFTTKNWIKL